jgi:hypothetical protein
MLLMNSAAPKISGLPHRAVSFLLQDNWFIQGYADILPLHLVQKGLA